MSKNEEWSVFLSNLLSHAVLDHKATKENQYLKQSQEQVEEMLTTNLNKDQKVMVDEIIFENGVSAERESEIIYQQGFRDCVWILKNLGVLA